MPPKSVPIPPSNWSLLVYHIPSKPVRLRASIWRKLKRLGAVYVQNSVVAIPVSQGGQRAFRSLRAEIGKMGGNAYLFDATAIDGHARLVDTFNVARDNEYQEVIDRCEGFLNQIQKECDHGNPTYAELEENDEELTKLKNRLEKVCARDALSASKQTAAFEAVTKCEQTLEAYAERVYAQGREERRSIL